MSREVQFFIDEPCDLCNKMGAFDFMGDYICQQCYKKYKIEEYKKKDKRCQAEDH